MDRPTIDTVSKLVDLIRAANDRAHDRSEALDHARLALAFISDCQKASEAHAAVLLAFEAGRELGHCECHLEYEKTLELINETYNQIRVTLEASGLVK